MHGTEGRYSLGTGPLAHDAWADRDAKLNGSHLPGHDP